MKDNLKNGFLKDQLNHKLMLSYWRTLETYIRVDLEEEEFVQRGKN